MSQAGSFKTGGVVPPGTYVETLTGNSGGAVGPDLSGNIQVVGDGTTIDIVGVPGSNTLTASVINGGGAIQTIDGDIGSVTGSTVTIYANNAANDCGSSVLFATDSPTSLRLQVTDANFNTTYGLSAGNASLPAGQSNCCFGWQSGSSITGGGAFTPYGNTLFGTSSGYQITSGQGNVGIGVLTLGQLVSGNYNMAIGYASGNNYTSSESSNIIIGDSNLGVTGESNTLRIASGTGTGNGQLSKAFICGIDGVDLSSVNVVTEVSNQLGSAAITAGSGISVTTGSNQIIITNTAPATAILTYTNVNTSPYVVLTTDQYISVDSSGGAITIRLPNAATLGKSFTIKDRTGSAATNNITVTTVGGAVNIDGAATFVMNSAYEAINIIGNGSTYEVY